MSPIETINVAPEVYDSVDSVDEGRFMRRARRVVSRMPMVRHAVAMWHALRDDATPIGAKGMIVAAIAYFMLPADLIPDFLVGMGLTDDAAVLAATLKTMSQHLKPEHYRRADQSLGLKDRDPGRVAGRPTALRELDRGENID